MIQRGLPISGLALLVGMMSLQMLGCINPADEIVEKSEGMGSLVFVKQNSVLRQNRNIAMAANPDEFYPGTDIFQLSPISTNGKLTNLTGAFTRSTSSWGAAEDPEISYDGKKMLFAMRKSGANSDHWGIYEIDLSSGSLLALTSPTRWDDMDPAYLPDGNIVFTSTRNQIVDEYERRQAPQLFRGERLGGNGAISYTRQLSFNQSHDQNPFVHSSGLVYYSRWDHLGSPNKMPLFSIHPDGTRQFVLYGSDETFGYTTGLASGMRAFMEARELADGGIISSLMERTSPFEGGAICIIDLGKLISNPPLILTSSASPYNFDGRKLLTTSQFKTPYPIMDKGKERILVAQSARDVGENTTDQANFDLFVMDKDGSHLQIVHIDPNYNDYDPIVVAPRTAPKVFPIDPHVAEGLKSQGTTGFFFDASVYSRDKTLDGQPIPAPGTIQYMRVIEAIPLPRSQDIRGGSLGETEFEKQKVMGYANVETDGSFAVEVPALTSMHMQALDRNGLMVVNQLQWIHVQPGERRICSGCHVPRNKDATIKYIRDSIEIDTVVNLLDPVIKYMATFSKAQKVWTHSAATADTFDFYDAKAMSISGSKPMRNATVQTVLNHSCISCHSIASPAGKLVLEEDTAAPKYSTTERDFRGVSKVYQRLLQDSGYIAASGGPLPYVMSRGARQSPLAWVLFNKQLNGSTGQFRPLTLDHSLPWLKDGDGNILPFAPENRDLLTLIEWMDMGAQFSNTVGYKADY